MLVLRPLSRVLRTFRSAASRRGAARSTALHSSLLLVILAGTLGAYTMGDKTSVAESPQAAPLASSADLPPAFELSGPTTGRLSASTSTPLLVDVARSYPFIWPALGPITSNMDSSHPLGIDIGLRGDQDAPILATAGGVVTFAGGGPSLDYGYYVTVDHGGGLSSLYAHLARVDVVQGQRVEQGAQLGLGGSTGKSDGKHLHLEITNNNQRLDPMRLLPVSTKPGETSRVDCGASAVVINQGSRAVFDFDGVLSGGIVTGATFEPIETRVGTAPIWATVEGLTSVVLMTQPAIGGVEEHFSLRITTAGSAVNALECEVVVKPMNVVPSYYVRAPQSTAVAATATPTSNASDISEAPEATETPSEASVAPVATASSTPSAAVSATPVATGTPATGTPAPAVTTTATPAVSATPPPATATTAPASPSPTQPAAPSTATPTPTSAAR